MSAEEFETGVRIQAATERHGEEVEELDQTVSQYGEAVERYGEDEDSTQEVEEAVDEVLECFHGLFETQNWLGEITAEITGQKLQDDYQKFTAYRGLVCAADQIENEQDNSVNGPRVPTGTGVLKEESETLIDSWRNMLRAYEEAVRYEDRAQQISLEKGREEEGLNPYAFETPFQALEAEYGRVSDLNQCVNTGYR